MSKKVAIIMGSNSDYKTLRNTQEYLKKFNLSFDSLVVSAHRSAEKMVAFAKSAKQKGYAVIIAGAGGAAHLPGMVASLTTLPVIGVPIKSKQMDGLDSLLSINQMPAGVPVATMAVGKAGAINAAIFAARIFGISDQIMTKYLQEFAQEQIDMVANMKVE